MTYAEKNKLDEKNSEKIKDSLYIAFTKKNQEEGITTGELIDNNKQDKSEKNSISPCSELKTLDFSALKKKSLNDPAVYKKLLDIGNKICAEGIAFKVQIAAYRNPENYKWNHLQEFGQPDMQKLEDGITRFTQGSFNSLLEAEEQRKKSIAKGQRDAWITAIIGGKRYTLEELIMVDFFNKNMTQFEKHYKELEEILAQNP